MPVHTANAQADLHFYGYSYNHLDWYTIESDHFKIIFQEGNSQSAQVISRIAEEIYGPITELYDHEPNTKVSIVLKDREDYSNGAAYFFDNKIDIWVPALDTPLRGTHNWLRNVISHEFTHIVQIQASMKNSRRYPATYVQWLNYESVRRPDVLYGFPNGIATVPFASVSVPAWLAEGTAQYQRASMLYDTWDSHRDMILRTRIMQTQPLSLDQMGSFSSKTSLERETIYNHGFAFSIWLSNKYGEHVLKDISVALSKTGVQNVSEAIKIATGTSGYELHEQWTSELKKEYTERLDLVKPETEKLIEEGGFYNFFPIKRPGTNQIAYISNKGFDFGFMKLYLHDIKTGETVLAHTFSEEQSPVHTHTMSCGHSASAILLMGISPFSFTEDGNKLMYSRLQLNKFGEEYADIFEFDLKTRKEKRLSFSARLSDPVLIDNQRILAITRRDGTQNLVILNPADSSITPVTFFEKGEQVFSPNWNKETNEVLFAYSDFNHREIRLVNLETGEQEQLLSNEKADFRDPQWLENKNGFVYSSNPDGIFNIYEYDFVTGEHKKLTSVIGGAFMPVIVGNELIYSSYQATGYKVAEKTLDNGVEVQTGSYTPVLAKDTKAAIKDYSALNVFDDSDLSSLHIIQSKRIDQAAEQIQIETRNSSSNRTYYRYKDTFTKMSVFPMVRFDNYTTPNGSNGSLFINAQAGKLAQNLWRDAKVGLYLASREVIDRLTIYSGLMFGLGSLPSDGASDFIQPNRLVNLDRDLFLIAEYQGLPFIKTHWSPTVSIELYNLRRNVDNGVSVEEFPCVSCLPDTTTADIAYDIWEADLYLRSKLNRFSMLELGAQYTPYQVTVNPFFSREYKQMLAASSSQYYIGKSLSATYYLNTDMYHVHDDVAPIGFKGYVKYAYQPSKLLDTYELKDGLLIPVYDEYNNQSIEVKGRYGFKLGNQFLSVNSRFFTYLNKQNEYFFLDYIGGLIGMRSYSFFALGGSTTAYSTLSWNVPILTHLNKQINRFTVDKLFLRLFAEAGNGWGGPLAVNKDIKSGVGAELRFSFNTNYLFPTKLFFSGSYGFNEYDLTLPTEFITSTSSNKMTYGREWLFHFGLLFDFEL
ncbi:hypothetical protein EP331_08415 [bacterium]|nr:MAG: hypothetical protein EP331_08415 [bacterium]